MDITTSNEMDEPVKDKMSGRSRALGQLMLGHNLDRERERETCQPAWGGGDMEWTPGRGVVVAQGRLGNKQGGGLGGALWGQGCRGITQSCRNRDRGN